MGYIENNLIGGESVIYHARLHWIILIKPVLVSLVLIAAAVASFYFADTGSPENATLLQRIGSGLIVLAVIPLIVAGIRRASREYAVTNKRVIMQIGAVQRKTEEMFLTKIESIGVDQSVTGRMLGYGTVVIRGTGGSFEPFERVSAPLELRRQIQEQIGRSLDGNVGNVGDAGNAGNAARTKF
jgi:uncharacterized membrane protein YdbT with pleckstrin-like domain